MEKGPFSPDMLRSFPGLLSPVCGTQCLLSVLSICYPNLGYNLEV